MEDPLPDLRSRIVRNLTEQATLKLRVADNTSTAFNSLKELLHEFETELDDELDERIDRRIKIEYKDRGKFEAQVQLADDVLIFVMHTNVFCLPDSQRITEYARKEGNQYCGIVNVYNFLADSFRNNRTTDDDEGQLIGRLFVNHEQSYFVESRAEGVVGADRYGRHQLTAAALADFFKQMIIYALTEELAVPDFEAEANVRVEQFNSRLEPTRLKVAK